jgi:hypothetical protein
MPIDHLSSKHKQEPEMINNTVIWTPPPKTDSQSAEFWGPCRSTQMHSDSLTRLKCRLRQT